MRSLGSTLFLALFACILAALAGWRWTGGNFDSLLGSPPVPVGSRIYQSFAPPDVKRIHIAHDGVVADFAFGKNGWQAEKPWRDRMDPRAAVGIINFTLGMRVEDSAPASEIDEAKAGLGDNGINIRLEGEGGRILARYKLGRRTPWLATVKDLDKPVPTVFVRPRDENRKRHIYSCTGDIGPVFKDGLRYLRDHRPFYFNPIGLQRVRIRADEGELTLGRETPESSWRVIKPLDLATDPKAMQSLLEGLYELQASKLTDRAAVTLPAGESLAKSGQISLISFGSETETTLDLFPPETPESREVRAIVSDRPDTIFDLPLKPETDLVSLADLPLAVNDLRDATLTNLSIQSLRGVLIQPATGTEILITRTPPAPWMATINETSQEANEERLFSLLKAVTESRAIGFESDAATDFTPWGLHKPFLKLRFLGEDNQSLELAFGIDGKGDYFVNRLGTPTVMRVDPSLVSSIPVRTYEWRHSRLWSLNRLNLIAIEQGIGAKNPLMLHYNFWEDSWTATRVNANGGSTVVSTDLTAGIDPARASFLLASLEGLKVSRWLSPMDEGANKALSRPSLIIKVVEKQTDDDGKLTGLLSREISFAPPATGGNPGFYYGRLGNDENPFLLDRETYAKLVTEVVENDP